MKSLHRGGPSHWAHGTPRPALHDPPPPKCGFAVWARAPAQQGLAICTPNQLPGPHSRRVNQPGRSLWLSGVFLRELQKGQASWSADSRALCLGGAAGSPEAPAGGVHSHDYCQETSAGFRFPSPGVYLTPRVPHRGKCGKVIPVGSTQPPRAAPPRAWRSVMAPAGGGLPLRAA